MKRYIQEVELIGLDSKLDMEREGEEGEDKDEVQVFSLIIWCIEGLFIQEGNFRRGVSLREKMRNLGMGMLSLKSLLDL